MAYNRNHAKRLLSDSEMPLFVASLRDHIGDLSPGDLKKKIERTRKLRDKYTDLYRRQSLASRKRTGSKRGTTGIANERTSQKATVFSEVLTRFETQLAKVERANARESKRAALERARKAKGGGGRTTPKQTPAAAKNARATTKGKTQGPKDFMSEQANAARNRTKIASPRNKTISAHVGARGKRNQAKRDSR
jgi:hypothetical protein